MLLSIIVFLLVLGLLIFVHEFGHFIVAKKAGLKVEEFGFGFPPKIFGIKRGDTTYSLNLIPIGGFVRILGEDGDKRDDPKSFASKGIGIRALILSAGVIMNILLAMVLLIIGFKMGLPTVVEDDGANVRDAKVQVVEIAQDTPADEAGLMVGDEIVAIGGQEVDSVEDVQEITGDYLDEEVVVTIKKGDEESKIDITPRANPPEGEGAMGIALVKTGIVSYPFFTSVWKGISTTFMLLGAIIVAFYEIIKNIFVGNGVAEELSGPIGIAVMTGQVTKMGFAYILQFTAVLSINLAILNFLPIPALDGGRVLFLIVEKIRGKKITQKTENIIHTSGFVFLIILMILVTFRDVFKFSDVLINIWHKIIG